MEQETNELGEVYYWEFTPTKLTTWDEAVKPWESPNTIQPWDTYGISGNWTVRTERTLRFGEQTRSHAEKTSKEYLTFMEFHKGILYKDGDVIDEEDHTINNHDAVLHDLEVENTPKTLAETRDKAESGAPIGYASARPLVPGEYTYQKALVGIRMRAASLGTAVGFYGMVHNVDVEDVVDRGNVEVISTDPENPTIVKLKKYYYNPPEELMFTIMDYAEPCVVKVLYKTEEEFAIMLKSTLESERYVTGQVSWLATGY